jgi:RTX calcium-binding nonapeptide repeat (4 copies)
MITRRGKRIALPVWIAGVTLMLPAVARAAPPTNDGFATPTVVPSLPFDQTTSTAEATVEPGEPQPSCNASMGKSVWYEFTPAEDVLVAAATSGSDFDTVLTVWTGATLGSLVEKRCRDIEGETEFRLAFLAEAGTPYRFQVGGAGGAGGSLRFRLRPLIGGIISGRVTEEGTSAPLGSICVQAFEADFPDQQFRSTDGQGRYEVVVRPGNYLVSFEDFCDETSDHRDEWYRESVNSEGAEILTVVNGQEISGIDGTLTPTCPWMGDFQGPQFIGTNGPDTFAGGQEAEVFCGLGGKDRIRGGGGNDEILGGPGHDVLSGQGGNDDLIAGAGNDILMGGAGKDRLIGEGGNDDLRGGPEYDRCYGGQKDDADRARQCEKVRDVP